jgi:fibronectin-binding autotransporter adhesin
LTGSGSIDSAGDPSDKVILSGNITESAPGATLAIGGTRRVVLSGASDYTGATTVGGTVTLQASGSLTSSISVGATAAIDGEGTITGSITLANGATIRFNPATTGPDQHFRPAEVIVAPGEIVNVSANTGIPGTGIVVLHDPTGGLDLGNFSLNNPGRATLTLGGAGGDSDLLYNLDPANLEWRGFSDTVWRQDDVVENFQNLGTGLPDVFLHRDNVDFVDAATGTVSVASNILAGNVAFKNTTGNNVFLVSSAAETMDAVSVATTSSGDATVSTPITGSTAITAGGSGILTLTAANTATGAITVNAGTLILNNPNNSASSLAVNAGALQIGAGGIVGTIPNIAFTNNGSVTVNRSDALTLASVISGSGTFTQAGAGTTTLTAENDYSGLTTVNAGVLQVGNGGTGSIVSDVLVNSPAASLDFSRTNDLTYAGNITGTGAVAKRGTGTLTLNGSNSFGGGLNLYNGILIAADAQVGTGSITMGPGLANTNTLSVAGGTMDNDIFFSSVGTGLKIVNIAAGFIDATLSGTIHLDANGAAGTQGISRISTNFGTIVISGKMTGTGTAGYAKRQNGQVVITNPDNDYTGGTNIVDSGVLLVDGKVPGNAYFGESIDAGGTGIMDSTLGGSGLIGGNVKLQAPSRLSPGGTAAGGVHTETRGTLTIGGNLEVDLVGTGAGRVVMQLGALAGPNDRVNVGGTLSLGSGVIGLTEITIGDAGGLEPGVYTLIDAATIDGTLDAANVTAEVAPGLNGTISVSGTDLILTVSASGNPYNAWASTFPGLTDSSFNVDFDGDGVDTGLEWILGGNPTVNDAAAIRPVVTATSASGITLVFNREEDSIGVATVAVEYGTTLDTWPGSVAIGATSSIPDVNGVAVNVNDVPNPDAVTVTIPASNAAGGKLFARLKATMP